MEIDLKKGLLYLPLDKKMPVKVTVHVDSWTGTGWVRETLSEWREAEVVNV